MSVPRPAIAKQVRKDLAGPRVEVSGAPDARRAGQVLPILQRLAQAVARSESGDMADARGDLLQKLEG